MPASFSPQAARPAEGGYTDVFEIICCDCGDDPDLDYREVSAGLQRIRGPYPIAAGVAAYDQHLKRHPNRRPVHQSGGLVRAGTSHGRQELHHGKRHHRCRR